MARLYDHVTRRHPLGAHAADNNLLTRASYGQTEDRCPMEASLTHGEPAEQELQPFLDDNSSDGSDSPDYHNSGCARSIVVPKWRALRWPPTTL